LTQLPTSFSFIPLERSVVKTLSSKNLAAIYHAGGEIFLAA
jgi:hypothetical protein